MRSRQFVEVVSVLKAGEGGCGSKHVVWLLKQARIPAKTQPSPFVGHTAVLVPKESLAQARRLLEREGLL